MAARILELRGKLGKAQQQLAATELNLLTVARRENRGLRADEQHMIDLAQTGVELLEADIKAEEKQMDLERRLGSKAPPRPGAIQIRSFGPVGGGSFGDTENDEPRILRADESVRDWLRTQQLDSHPGDESVRLGDVVRGMIIGPGGNPRIQAALNEGTDSAGGYMAPVYHAGFMIDLYRPMSRIFQAGAGTLPLLGKETGIPKLTADPVVAWRAENAAVAEGTATFGLVRMVPRSLAVHVIVSRELLEDAAGAGAAIENAIAKATAQEVDRVALYGNGASEPPGVTTIIPSANVVDMGAAAGAALTNFDPIVDAVLKLEQANVPRVTAAIMAPRTDAEMAKLKDSTDQPLRKPSKIESLPFLPTTKISVAETHGSASDASRIVIGDYSQMVVGVRTELRIEVLREIKSLTGQIVLLAWWRGTIGYLHDEAFSQVTGIIPPAP